MSNNKLNSRNSNTTNKMSNNTSNNNGNEFQCLLSPFSYTKELSPSRHGRFRWVKRECCRVVFFNVSQRGLVLCSLLSHDYSNTNIQPYQVFEERGSIVFLTFVHFHVDLEKHEFQVKATFDTRACDNGQQHKTNSNFGRSTGNINDNNTITNKNNNNSRSDIGNKSNRNNSSINTIDSDEKHTINNTSSDNTNNKNANNTNTYSNNTHASRDSYNNDDNSGTNSTFNNNISNNTNSNNTNNNGNNSSFNNNSSDNTNNSSDNTNNNTRNTYEECYDFIIKFKEGQSTLFF